MGQAAIEAVGLTKTFPGGTVAINELDLEIRRGAVYGLMGRNGAGKTTLLRLLMGMLQPNRGAARVLGLELGRAPRRVRERVAYVSQKHQLPGGMTLQELGRWMGRLNSRWDDAHARQLAERWQVPENRVLAAMSSGEQRKAAIMAAFACRPEVLLLDEPAAGFDVVARRELVDLIVDTITQADGCTVLLSTHIISDLERVADYIGVIACGRMAMSTRMEDLLNSTRRVQVVFEDEQPPIDFIIPGSLTSRRSGPVVNAVVQWTNEGELEILRNCVKGRVQVFPLGLEEIFLELFGNNKGTPDEPLQVLRAIQEETV